MSDTNPVQNANQAEPSGKDAQPNANNPESGGDEISASGKWIAGILLSFFIIAPAFIIIALWPDRSATAKERIKPLYINEWFHVRLACIPDSICCIDTVIISNSYPDTMNHSGKDTSAAVAAVKTNIAPDTGARPAAGPRGAGPAVGATRIGSPETGSGAQADKRTFIVSSRRYTVKDLIHINTLLLILVAAAGFVGNMIYIASSFTTFVGASKFKRSWILWYCVKPFTASALALGLYFVFRGGFLNMSDDSTNINIYGVITLSILTGLYTDRATMKLRDVVNTIFGIKDGDDARPNKLHSSTSGAVQTGGAAAQTGGAAAQTKGAAAQTSGTPQDVPLPAKSTEALAEPASVAVTAPIHEPTTAASSVAPTVTSVSPAAIQKGTANTITVHGTMLNQRLLMITIQEVPVEAGVITLSTITFQYTLPDAFANLTTLKVDIRDESGNDYYSGLIGIIQD